MDYDFPYAVFHYRCLLEYGWDHIHNCNYCQLLFTLVAMWRGNDNTSAPYPNSMIYSRPQSTYFPAYLPVVDVPISDTKDPFGVEDIDVLAGRMANASLTPVASSSSADPALYQPPAQQSLRASSYNVSAPWPGGYPDVHQDTGPSSEDIYDGQHVNPMEPPTDIAPIAPSPVRSISTVDHLEQGTYPRKQVVQGRPAGPICFNDGLGVSLGSLATLVNGGEPAFDAAADIGEKASVRFELPQFPGHSIQVRVRRGDNKGHDGRPITVREMGDTVFKELRKLMEQGKAKGTPLQHRGDAVDIERVLLLRVDQISKGSIQPILGMGRR